MKYSYNAFRSMLVILLLLTYMPFSKAEDGDDDSWEVEIIKKETGEVVKSEVVDINFFPLAGLESGIEYYAKIRTKNTFLSGWAVSDIFILDSTSGTVPGCAAGLVLSSNNGVIFISSDIAQQINIYAIDGRLLRSVSLSAGETAVTGLVKGAYLIDEQKIIVK